MKRSVDVIISSCNYTVDPILIIFSLILQTVTQAHRVSIYVGVTTMIESQRGSIV